MQESQKSKKRRQRPVSRVFDLIATGATRLNTCARGPLGHRLGVRPASVTLCPAAGRPCLAVPASLGLSQLPAIVRACLLTDPG